jgi:ABC-type antimicrobial peptide transport system permease subunit
VTGLVVREGLRAVFVGLAAGALVGIGAAQALRAALFGLSPLDPVAFAGMASLILVSSLIAVWRTARRAARVEPMAALRAD